MDDKPRLHSAEVHFVNGQVTRYQFAAENESVVELLASADSLFSRPILILSTRYGLTAVPTSGVTRVEFMGVALPVAPYLYGATRIEQISEQSFRAAFDPIEMGEARRQAWEQPGATQEGFVEFNMADGERVIWRVVMASRRLNAADLPAYIGAMLNSSGLHAEIEYGGVTIINPRHILSASFYPGPPDLPPETWDVSSSG